MSDETTPEDDTIGVPVLSKKPVQLKKMSPALRPADERIMNLEDFRTAVETLGRTIAVVTTAYEQLRAIVFSDEHSIVHACPRDSSGIMPCCGKKSFDVPLTEPISIDGMAVTCRG